MATTLEIIQGIQQAAARRSRDRRARPVLRPERGQEGRGA